MVLLVIESANTPPSFVHTITQEESVERPCEARGGLLADTMGTGKSLILLAVILHTLDETRVRSRQGNDPHRGKSSGATLIIAPKSSTYPAQAYGSW